MKEVIVERLVRTTEIIKMDDEAADIYVQQVKTVDDQRAWGANAKEVLNLDDANVSDVKVFVRDIPDKETKTKKSRKKEK